MVSDSRQAGEVEREEVKVTPEMIEAGVEAMVSSMPEFESFAEIAASIYLAMKTAERRISCG